MNRTVRRTIVWYYLRCGPNDDRMESSVISTDIKNGTNNKSSPNRSEMGTYEVSEELNLDYQLN